MLGRKQATALGLALVAVLVGAGLGSTTTPGTAGSTTMVATDQASTGLDGLIAVHVSGGVATPGIVRLHDGAIVADAVAAAGGAIVGALLDSVNLAAPVLEGDHVHIPAPGEEAAGAPASGTGTGGGPISLNRSDAAALETLPGIGPVTAQRIVDHRDANGPYRSVDDLLEVAGIGEVKLAAIRDLVVP